MEEAGLLRLHRNKCSFMSTSVAYLGYKIDSKGLHPLLEKIEAVMKAAIPRNVTQLKLYIGLLSYYNRFLPNLTDTLAPLYKLLKNTLSGNGIKNSNKYLNH